MVQRLFRALGTAGPKALPADAAPALVPAATGDDALAESRLASIRETIDLLEADLATMIRDVQRAAESVRDGGRASGQALGAIRERTAVLVTMAREAQQDAARLASATKEFSGSSTEISQKVQEA